MSGIEQFGELSRAEAEFVAACQSGESCTLGDGVLPDVQDTSRAVRGELIRFFVLGGSEETPLHERGIALHGAMISGHLDLSGSNSDCDLILNNCIFRRRPLMLGTRLRSCDLTGSKCPGFDAEGLTVERALILGPGFEANGTVRLVRARIGADLDCTGARFECPDGDALNGDGAEIGGSIFLRGQKSGPVFASHGTVRFVSVGVGDSIILQDAWLDSGDRKYALSLALAQVQRQLTLKSFEKFSGRLNLSGVTAYSLDDDPAEAQSPKDLILNGFTYVHFSGKAPLDAALRLEWLSRQKPSAYGQDFWPQPYGQLAKVYSDTGHEADARQVLIEKERLQGRVAFSLAQRQGRAFRALQIWLGDQIMRRLIGYGYRPQRSLAVLFAILAATSLFFHLTWKAGDMAPSAAPVLVSQGWADALAADSKHTAAYWGTTPAGQDYETFHPVAYAFDLFVPLVDLGQESAWSPSTERGPLGRVGWWLRWLLEIVGWVVTAVAAAAVTGLVRRG